MYEKMCPYSIVFAMKDGRVLVYCGYARNAIEARNLAEKQYIKKPGLWLLDVDEVKTYAVRKRQHPGVLLMHGETRESPRSKLDYKRPELLRNQP